MSRKFTIEEVNERIIEKHGNTITMTEYVSTNTLAIFECKICGNIWKTKPSVIINKGTGCRICYNKSVAIRCSISIEEIEKRIFLTHGNKITLLKYGGSATSLSVFQCNICHNIWTTNAKGIYRGNGCWKCGVVSRGIKHRGSKSNLWKGGITKLRPFIKGGLDKWQEDSMRASDFQCILTGSKDFHIHHLYPLNNIIKDSLIELGLEEYQFVNEYSEDDVSPIVDKVLEIHYRYPLGICLRKDIHKLFHKIYGKIDCTPEDFYEFRDKINSGEIKI